MQAGVTMKKLFPVVALLFVVAAVFVGCSKPAEEQPVVPPVDTNAPAIPPKP